MHKFYTNNKSDIAFLFVVLLLCALAYGVMPFFSVMTRGAFLSFAALIFGFFMPSLIRHFLGHNSD